MFDKLIVSDEQGAEFKGRSRYFMVSTVVVGILFVTALVFSLYAADIGLGNDEFEVSMMIAPVPPDAPEPPKPLQLQNEPQKRSDVPTRISNMLRLDEVPLKAPTEISVTQNPSLARPIGRFELAPIESSGPGTPESGETRRVPDGTGSSVTSEPVADSVKIPDPPPVIVPKPPAKTVVSEGVINGKATFLPAPPYPKPAQMVNAYGAVNVQVTIDEMGKVISSKAISGHPLLKQAAETAAWRAKFSPTLLSKVPVKVTGVIVYNFKRS
jgi:TonB family protein